MASPEQPVGRIFPSQAPYTPSSYVSVMYQPAHCKSFPKLSMKVPYLLVRILACSLVRVLSIPFLLLIEYNLGRVK